MNRIFTLCSLFYFSLQVNASSPPPHERPPGVSPPAVGDDALTVESTGDSERQDGALPLPPSIPRLGLLPSDLTHASSARLMERVDEAIGGEPIVPAPLSRRATLAQQPHQGAAQSLRAVPDIRSRSASAPEQTTMTGLREFEAGHTVSVQGSRPQDDLPIFTAIGANFPGGGARGGSALLALENLEERVRGMIGVGELPRDVMFHYASGVSAGSILMAAYFLRKHPDPMHPDYKRPMYTMAQLYELYHDLSRVAFSHPRTFAFGGWRKPQYENTPLFRFLEKKFTYDLGDGVMRPATLLDTLVPVYITAVAVKSSGINAKVFSTIDAAKSMKDGNPKIGGDNFKLAVALMASASAPTKFDSFPVKSEFEASLGLDASAASAADRSEVSRSSGYYDSHPIQMIDGGIGYNDPSLAIIKVMEADNVDMSREVDNPRIIALYPAHLRPFLRKFASRAPGIRPLLVTFDTGDLQLTLSDSGRLPMSKMFLIKRSMILTLMCEAGKSITEQAMQRSPIEYFRISPLLSKDLYRFKMGPRELERFMDVTRTYLASTPVARMMDALARLLSGHLSALDVSKESGKTPEQVFMRIMEEYKMQFCHMMMHKKIENAVFGLTGKTLAEVDPIILGIIMKKFMISTPEQIRVMLEMAQPQIKDFIAKRMAQSVPRGVMRVLADKGFNPRRMGRRDFIMAIMDHVIEPLIRAEPGEYSLQIPPLRSTHTQSSPRVYVPSLFAREHGAAAAPALGVPTRIMSARIVPPLIVTPSPRPSSARSSTSSAGGASGRSSALGVLEGSDSDSDADSYASSEIDDNLSTIED